MTFIALCNQKSVILYQIIFSHTWLLLRYCNLIVPWNFWAMLNVFFGHDLPLLSWVNLHFVCLLELMIDDLSVIFNYKFINYRECPWFCTKMSMIINKFSFKWFFCRNKNPPLMSNQNLFIYFSCKTSIIET